MSINRKEMKARKLAVFAIVLDILTFSLGFGFIFIAIGHDANSATECTSTNGLCKTLTVNSVGTTNGVLCALSASAAGTSFYTGTFFSYATKLDGNLSFAVQIQAVSNITGLVMQYVVKQSTTFGTQACGTVNTPLQGITLDSGAFNYPVTGIGLSSTLSFKQNNVAIGTLYNYFIVAKFITVPAPASLTIQSGFATNMAAIET